MIKAQRQQQILSVLHREGAVAVGDLARLMPEVSRATIRRDIAELASAGALKRRHGGAVLPEARDWRRPGADAGRARDPAASVLDECDAIVLPPIPERGGGALRRRIRRRAIPFLAESAPQDGGTYLGPDNRAAGRGLGLLAGRQAAGEASAGVLLITQPELANTRARAEGFEEGFRAAFDGVARFVHVNGEGSYRASLRVALDAFHAEQTLSIVFGVNDHSALAGCDAAAQDGRAVRAYAVGGERPGFLAQVAGDGPLVAVAAFFPDVVGAVAIDALARALAGDPLPDVAATPYAIVTRENLRDYYQPDADGDWMLRPDVFARLVREAGPPPESYELRATVGFMPHYPAHDWYRIMAQSMRARAELYGIELTVSPPHHGIDAEIARLQRNIARHAVTCIRPGDTIIIGEGAATASLAEALRSLAASDPQAVEGLTVITNALDVMHLLQGSPLIKTILTSGEYQAADRCLVGPSLGALFERMRADVAFLAPAGVSPRFGLSALDERRALAGARLLEGARTTIALADHTLIGADANHRIARLDRVRQVITDDGGLPGERQSLRAAGVTVLVAGHAEDLAASTAPPGMRGESSSHAVSDGRNP